MKTNISKSSLFKYFKVFKVSLNFIILFHVLIIPSILFGQERCIVIISEDEKSLPERLCDQHFEIVNFSDKSGVELLVNKDQFKKLTELGFNPVIKTTEDELISNLKAGMMIEAYRSYEEILAKLQDYASNYPDICQLYDIGNSLGNEYWEQGYDAYEDYQHDIWALKISDNPGIEEDEPSLLYDAAHHARETIGPAVVMNFTQYLFDNYGVDQEVTDAINNNQIWIVPLVNPDGYKIVTDSLEIWWRKTIRDNNNNHLIDAFIPDWIEPDGVDPNRNYGIYWGGDWNTAPSFRESYRGPWSFSEPCIQVMRDLLGSHHFVTELSYHSYGERFFYPWSYDPIQYQTPDHDLYSTLGTELAEMTPKLDGGNYLASSFGSIIMLTGSTMDYAYGKHGIIIYTVELAQDFIPPPEDIDPICEANLAAQLYLLSRVHESILTGHVTDLNTGQPMVAKIFIEGIDNDPGGRFDYISDTTYGRFYRLLNTGDYDVTFSAFGYQSQTFSININDSGPTILEVGLGQDVSIGLDGYVSDDFGNPISDAQIVIVNAPLDTLYSDGSGLFYVDPFYAGQYQFKISAEGYFTNDTLIEIDEQNNNLDFVLMPYDIIDFEEEWELDYFSMIGHHNWIRDNQVAFHENYSLAAPVLSVYQYASTFLDLTFDNDKLMSFATRVSLDSITQGMIFTMDECMMKTYYGDEDWVSDTFFIPAGTHQFKWSLSRDYRTPGASYQNKCWIDMIEFDDYITLVGENLIEAGTLFRMYPNPTASSTTISIMPEVHSIYFAGVYSLTGELIRTLSSNISTSKQIQWDGNSTSGLSVPAGIYIIKIVTDKGIGSKKLIKI